MSRVSIIIPCYNAGEFLVEAVESALAQTHDDFEIVIVDDGSTDSVTVQLIESASWPRTRIIRQENSGPSVARNTAIDAATGEYILPLDADDKIASTYVEKAVKVITECPDVGIVYCKAMKFGAEEGPWQLPVYTLQELVIDNVIFVTSLYRKSDWKLIGGYNEKLRHGVEDYEFWVKLVNLGREVVQLDDFLFFYRIHAKSRTSGFAKERSMVVNTYAEIFRSNTEFYAKHAEILFEHRFRLSEELLRYHARYGKIEALVAKHVWLRNVARFASRLLARFD